MIYKAMNGFKITHLARRRIFLWETMQYNFISQNKWRSQVFQ